MTVGVVLTTIYIHLTFKVFFVRFKIVLMHKRFFLCMIIVSIANNTDVKNHAITAKVGCTEGLVILGFKKVFFLPFFFFRLLLLTESLKQVSQIQTGTPRK